PRNMHYFRVSSRSDAMFSLSRRAPSRNSRDVRSFSCSVLWLLFRGCFFYSCFDSGTNVDVFVPSLNVRQSTAHDKPARTKLLEELQRRLSRRRPCLLGSVSEELVVTIQHRSDCLRPEEFRCRLA